MMIYDAIKAGTLRKRAETYRKLGIRLQKENNEQEAMGNFEESERYLRNALQGIDPNIDSVAQFIVEEFSDESSRALELIAGDLAETFGSLGGILRRLEGDRLSEALASYRQGAGIEEEFRLKSTYNRLNLMKVELSLGVKKLHDLVPDIRKLADVIERNLEEETELRSEEAETPLSDSGWAWADLGDCYALLGDLDKASAMYRSFIEKSETKSPETSLSVLNELVQRLSLLGDPDAPRLKKAAEVLRERMVN